MCPLPGECQQAWGELHLPQSCGWAVSKGVGKIGNLSWSAPESRKGLAYRGLGCKAWSWLLARECGGKGSLQGVEMGPKEEGKQEGNWSPGGRHC